MPVKLFSDDKRNVVIRPLAYCAEETILAYAKERGFPIIPCGLCSMQPELQRAKMAQLLDRLEERNPDVRNIAFAALSNVVASHLLDRRLHDTDNESPMEGQ